MRRIFPQAMQPLDVHWFCARAASQRMDSTVAIARMLQRERDQFLLQRRVFEASRFGLSHQSALHAKHLARRALQQGLTLPDQNHALQISHRVSLLVGRHHFCVQLLQSQFVQGQLGHRLFEFLVSASSSLIPGALWAVLR